MSDRKLRIGCASGFWGDTPEAIGQLVSKGEIDYLVFDYLAEVTMSLMARARAKAPESGYAPDFVKALAPWLPDIKAKGIKVVANAGGVNPRGCSDALAKAAAQAGIDLSIGVVLGDDLLPRADEIRKNGQTEMFSGVEFPDDIWSMNAYLGARPIAAALDAGADIVITGRCADSAVALGTLMHEYGWGDDDWDKLSQGSLAGHLIECGPQGTGGNFTDWQDVPGWDNMGMPIVEVSEDGSFIMTKTPDTGGLVVPGSVGEQMLYEIGDPRAYLLPDVICDWSGVTLEQVGPDQVLVKGGRGLGRTDSYKVSATHADGWRAVSTLTLAAIDAPAKSERVAEAILTRCRRIFHDRNMGDFRQVSVEVLGAEAAYGANARARTREVVLKIGAVHDDRAALNIFAGEIAPMAISTAQGLTGFFAGRPKVQPVVRLFSFLQSKAETPVAVEVDGKDVPVSVATTPVHLDPTAAPLADSRELGPDAVKVRLVELAWGRSGDKGDIANIGILARKPDYLPYIRSALSEEVVKDYFAHVCEGRVERFDLPGSHSLNFLLHESLGGGGIASVRIDPQGKGFAQMLLDIEIPVPADLAARDGLNAANPN
ncbi:terpene utilization protein AtuA [Roseovarius atlanticus]|uniref:Terpene utilization protein AtuA n=1 Tax=Roseovarius atlanticus TaxID=1641875 RepID=A0A0T5NP02_9RHOB|nr:acyclic terpene utilization AtuA family protein [Roseovarius atlanticus]KRS10358.1 terpene utilization protein AtuA [Roseovarius atlanticus]